MSQIIFIKVKTNLDKKILINTNFHRLQMPRALFQFYFSAIFKQKFFVEKISPISLRQGRASLLTTSMPRELTSSEQDFTGRAWGLLACGVSRMILAWPFCSHYTHTNTQNVLPIVAIGTSPVQRVTQQPENKNAFP